MGGAVSAGQDNDELIDNLKGGKYIRTARVERVFRALDRGDYMLPHSRDSAYKDLAWKDGPLHLSAPCIYSEVMEGLELRKGLSFLNVGSGTGYLSTMAGLILGSGGINHGVEIHPVVIEYANRRHQEFLTESHSVDEFDFCEPKFVLGNGLCLAPLQTQYDRVYCGAGCPEEYSNYFKQLIKVGGILVMPLMDSLLQVRRVSQSAWVTRSLLSVSFAQLKVPTKEDTQNLIKLEELSPPSLQVLSRAVIRDAMRRAMLAAHPHLVPLPRRAPARPLAGPRRICIPIEDDSDLENLNALHDLDPATGGNEMNALLSLVLSMGQNRVAGSLLYDQPSSSSSSSSSVSSSLSASCGNTSGESDADHEDHDFTPPDADVDRPQTPVIMHRDAATIRQVDDGTKRPKADADDLLPSYDTDADKQFSHKVEHSKTDQVNDKSSKPKNKASSRQASCSFILRARDEPAARVGNVSMDWEERADSDAVATEETADATNSKGGESQPTANKDKKEKLKRQKFDSGLGEENSPENSSSIEKTESKSDESEEHSDCYSDILDESNQCEAIAGRSRVGRGGRAMKRSRCSVRARSSDSDGEEATRGARRRTKKRAAGAGLEAPGGAAEADQRRRAAVTTQMKMAANALPLPPSLRLYVNLGRDD